MTDAVPLTEELLRTMRTAARKAIELREQSITPRAILLALLDDPQTGPAIASAVDKENILAATSGEIFTHEDTLAFKTPDGRTSMWLSKDAYRIFTEGARSTEDRYTPKHLAQGLAAHATTTPSILTSIHVDPDKLIKAIATGARREEG